MAAQKYDRRLMMIFTKIVAAAMHVLLSANQSDISQRKG